MDDEKDRFSNEEIIGELDVVEEDTEIVQSNEIIVSGVIDEDESHKPSKDDQDEQEQASYILLVRTDENGETTHIQYLNQNEAEILEVDQEFGEQHVVVDDSSPNFIKQYRCNQCDYQVRLHSLL